MASLYSTAVLAIVKLIAIKKKDNYWFEPFLFSFGPTNLILTTWLVAFTFSIPPLVGFGKYDQSMVGVRYKSTQKYRTKTKLLHIATLISAAMAIY